MGVEKPALYYSDSYVIEIYPQGFNRQWANAGSYNNLAPSSRHTIIWYLKDSLWRINTSLGLNELTDEKQGDFMSFLEKSDREFSVVYTPGQNLEKFYHSKLLNHQEMKGYEIPWIRNKARLHFCKYVKYHIFWSSGYGSAPYNNEQHL